MDLTEALHALIDERLKEHGLIEAEAPGKQAKPAKAAKKAGNDEITLETLKEKVTELVNKKGKDAAKALLKEAKVEKLSELPEKHFAKFDRRLNEELKDEEEEGGDDLFGD